MATKTKKRTKKKRTCPPGYHRVEIEAEPGTPVIDKETGKYPDHKWKYEVKRGPDHWKGLSR